MKMARPIHARWFNPLSICVAWIALIVVFIHPPQGTGVQICWMKAMTNVPCPGCGMTRSMSSAVHGMLAESWGYHPFGVPILLLFAATAGLSIFPSKAKRCVVRALSRHSRPTNIAYIVFVTTFVTFGVVRSILHLVNSTA